MKEDTRKYVQGRPSITVMSILLPTILLLMFNSCKQADCCSNFQGIRLCEFDTPGSFDSWEEYRTYLQSEGYACN